MNINILARILMGLYKHSEDPNIQVSYQSKTIYVKRRSKWKRYTFGQMVTQCAHTNVYLRKLAGMDK